jgi:hypothetical protein
MPPKKDLSSWLVIFNASSFLMQMLVQPHECTIWKEDLYVLKQRGPGRVPTTRCPVTHHARHALEQLYRVPIQQLLVVPQTGG